MPSESQVEKKEQSSTREPEEQRPPVWEDDPRHLVLTLSRYKFVAKLLAGHAQVLEVGCGDAFATRLVQQEVECLTATDIEQAVVDRMLLRMDPRKPFECSQHDLLGSPFPGSFDAAYALDVIERIPATQEDVFVSNIIRSLTPKGVLVLGSRSLESQSQAPLGSKSGHMNWKSGKALHALMERHFHNVFLFSMNDEAVHAGFTPMAQYHIAIGCSPRESVMPAKSVLMQGTGANEGPLDLTIVVPCLNEQHHIGPTLDTIVSAMLELPFSYEVIVVDDGSTDETAKTIETYIEAHPGLPIHLIKHTSNRGLATSYVDGAFHGRGTYYRLVCGDNVEPKETLLACFKELGKADMIIPYHVGVLGKSETRKQLSGLYTFLVNMLSGYKIRYYNGLATHLRYNVMRWGPYSFGFGFQAELITRLLDEGITYIEIPVAVKHTEKSGINSAINYKNFLSVGHTLLDVLIRRVRRHTLRKN